ncbi:SRPBCC family protein [Arthrobacter cavernae]|uniref:SRPBCC family protein n=1 Tax=Arthrobacter cavernae TaxID=2817681 RepID=A0A939HGL6_9MICC|nr:SRPBCC family protein [Arthrobacter cavernae]MBO1267506.1 SRPBCC family protein [Arthrobacter cavernae]
MIDPYFVSRQRFIAAPAADIFEVLAQPALHSVIDGSNTVKSVRPNGPARLGPGAVFGMDMNMKIDYKMTNTVCEFEEGRRIAWRHFGKHIWRYILEPADGGTLVTEEWDAREVPTRLVMRLLGYARRNTASIDRTLEKLDAHLAGGTPRP